MALCRDCNKIFVRKGVCEKLCQKCARKRLDYGKLVWRRNYELRKKKEKHE